MLQYASAAGDSVDETCRQCEVAQQRGPVYFEIGDWQVVVAHAVLMTRYSSSSAGLGETHDSWQSDSHGCYAKVHAVPKGYKGIGTIVETISKVGWERRFLFQNLRGV